MSVLSQRRLVLSALVVGALLVATQPAQAGFAIKIGSTVINDGDPLDTSSATNSINVNIGTGANELNIPGMTGSIVGAITNTPGDSGGGLIDISFNLNTLNGASGGTVVIYASANNFTLPTFASNPLLMDLNLAPNGRGSFSVTGVSYADASNTFPFSTAGPSLTVGPATTGADLDSTGSFTRGVGDYSLTEKLTITLAAGGSTSGDLQFMTTPMAVPVPGGFLLALTGVPCLAAGTWLRRRLKKAPVPATK